MKKPIKFLIGFLVFGLLPMICVAISSSIATLGGCTLHEGYTNPCVFLGIDFGGLLYAFFVSGWFGLVTIPIGLFGVLFSLVWVIKNHVTSKP